MCNFENKTRLDDALLEQIRSVANGNHVQDYEIIKKGSRTFDLDLSLLFFWEFHGKKTITRQAGGKPSKKHLESEEFDQYIEEQIKFAANDRKIRANFLNMLRSTILNNHTINDYNQQHTIWQTDEFSTEETCYECMGTGDVHCNCYPHGQITCTQCNGMGKVHSTGDKWERCTWCYGSGSVTCPKCHGRTYVTCSNCGGCGFFEVYGIVQSIAEPTWNIKCACNQYGNELEVFLKSHSVDFIVEKLPFYYKHSQMLSNTQEKFTYQTQDLITELKFSIFDKNYICVAFLQTPPLAFVKPPFFDDLFADEIASLKNISNEKKITKRKAIEFFEQYRSQPVLDKSLMGIAKTTDRKKYKNIVIDSCDGYITQESASLFSNLMAKCLDKLSPLNSRLTWFFGSIAGIAPIFFGTEIIAEINPNPILSSFPILLGSILFLGFILLCISIGITKYKQSALPKEYRQPMQHLKVFIWFSLFCLLIWLCGIMYGYLAQDNQQLQLHKQVEKFIQTYIPSICPPL